MKKLPLFLVALLTGCGCDEYASQYSCDYVVNQATYEVWYWKNVFQGNEDDNIYIGSTVGLPECKSVAVNYADSIHEEWNERSYVCVLMKDGSRQEKHRLL